MGAHWSAGRKNVRRKPLEVLHCKWCNIEFGAVQKRASTCSSQCANKLRYSKLSHYHRCAECSKDFASKQAKAAYCSMDCHIAACVRRNAAWHAQNPVQNKKHASRADAYRLYGYRRRASYASTSVTKFSAESIFERDGWLCQICGEEVDRGLSWPHRNSVSLDHKIPIVMGGEHSPSNVQCAHLGCNSSKGARLQRAAA